jgi:hypothetical protein
MKTVIDKVLDYTNLSKGEDDKKSIGKCQI